jgi:Zn-dependent peptidase ImmA (M78 family)
MDEVVLLCSDNLGEVSGMDLRNEREAKNRVRLIVRDVFDKAGLDSAPPYFGQDHPVATTLRVNIREEAHPLNQGDGYYIPEPNPTILLDPSVSSQERRNFTFYHEIGHHLIRQDGLLYSFINEYAGDNIDRSIEHYCNLIAAEFLMPIEVMREYLKVHDFSLAVIPELDKLFPASKPAIAIQLAQAANHKCIIIVCEYGELPDRTGGYLSPEFQHSRNPCLHIRYSSSSSSSRYSCSRFMPIPRGHLIYTAYEEQEHLKGRGNTIFRSGNNWQVACEAFFYQGRVFGEFRFSEPQSVTQLSLFELL